MMPSIMRYNVTSERDPDLHCASICADRSIERFTIPKVLNYLCDRKANEEKKNLQ